MTSLRLIWPLAAAMLFPAFSIAHAQTCYEWPLESVYDGDTVRATVDGRSTPIRLLGLDTPELPPRAECEAEKLLGYAARDRLKALSQGAVVTFCPEGQDRYERTLATMLVDGRDAAEVLIEEHLAKPWTGRQVDWCGG